MVEHTQDDEPPPSRKLRLSVTPLSTLTLTLGLLLFLPSVTASDPFTSYPDAAPPSTRHTPIISTLTWILHNVVSLAAYLGGWENGRMSGKRQLDSGEIAEACIIPVLVALSGMFAGLTLGSVWPISRSGSWTLSSPALGAPRLATTPDPTDPQILLRRPDTTSSPEHIRHCETTRIRAAYHAHPVRPHHSASSPR